MKKVNSYKKDKRYDLNKNWDFVYIKYYQFKTHIVKNKITEKYKKV